MAFVHGKNTVVTLDGNDLSTYINDSRMSRRPDLHDNTTYGKDDHVFQAGLGNGTLAVSGLYDNTSSGPRDIIEPLIAGSNVTLIWRPEGTGSGLPQDSVSVAVQEYGETSPVAGYIAWAATFQFSDAITTTTQ